MRNNLFYILIICAFTEILTKNAGNNPAANEPIKHSREFYEEEAKRDIENLLNSIQNRGFSAEEEDESVSLNVPGSTKMMTRIDEVLEETKSKNTKKKQKILRSNAQNYVDNLNQGNMQNIPLNFRNSIKSPDLDYSEAHNSQYLQLINAHPNIGSVKSRISGGHNVNTMLRNQVNQVNIKPEVYPLSIKYEDNYGSSDVPLGEDTIRFSDQYYATDEDGLTKLINELDTNNNNENFIRTALPMSENFDIKELLNLLHSKHGEVIPTRIESDNNVKFYTQTANHLRPDNRLENDHIQFNDLHDYIETKDRDNSKTIFLRRNVGDKVDPATNERLDEFMKYLNIGKDLRTSHYTLYHDNRPRRQGDYRGRQRRSLTQAGYTQDPDTCKTYNENLAILWSNLSKLLNVTEQPNDRALHNIAMMIQAYLEHQNAKQAPDTTHKEKHQGPRDMISEITHKIKKLLDEAEVSAEKITKIIIKYLKPDYRETVIEDCPEVNKEYLSTSVNLLYKNYLENVECQGEEGDMARNKKQSLRERRGKTGKSLNVGHTTLSLLSSDYKPEYQTIHIGDELYNDYHKGKVPRQRPSNKNRRIFKPSKKRRSRPVNRSRNQKETEKIHTRSKSKSASKKLKKSSLKSNSVKTRCEKYATRKLIVSLRPVMERFMGVLECELDNTLRSVSFDRNSYNPYYLYASKFYSEEDRSRAKDAARQRNQPDNKKMHIKRDTSVEKDQDVHVRDDDNSAWVRKYSFDQIKSMNSATPSVIHGTDDREPATDKNKQNGNSDYLTTYNEYFQSPPLYDDYDGIYKTHKITSLNGFTSIIKPPTSLNDLKTTRDKQSNKELTLSSKEPETENSDEYDTYYDEIFTEPPNNNLLNVEKQTESSFIETPFIDLTKLRSEDQLIGEKSKTHLKNFESITEFLKKARDSSLQTPEFAVPFALNTNKGYVELTHLIKYPKILVYRPQFLVKNTMPYDDFLKTINNNNMTNDDVRLMKIVRHLPDSSVQVLFETEDLEAPLEVRNLDENRRSGLPDPVENYQLKSKIDTANENTNTDGGGSGDLIPLDINEARRKDFGALIKLDISNSQSDKLLFSHFKPESDSLRVNEEFTNFENSSDSNSTVLNSSESSTSFIPLPNLSSALLTDNPSLDSDKNEGSAVGSATGSQIGSGMKLGLETALNLGNKLNPTHESQWSSFFNKLFSSHPKSKTTKNSRIKSHSASNSHSHSLLPNSDSSNQKVGDDLSSSNQSVVLQWWSKWRNIVKGKIKQIIGKMASFADKIDHIVRT